jgi:hypothetical protein
MLLPILGEGIGQLRVDNLVGISQYFQQFVSDGFCPTPGKCNRLRENGALDLHLDFLIVFSSVSEQHR